MTTKIKTFNLSLQAIQIIRKYRLETGRSSDSNALENLLKNYELNKKKNERTS